VTQPPQKVHSKLQMKAWASWGRGESHRSQTGRISSKGGRQRLDPVSTKSVLTPVSPLS
jgi:hypothetical protein